MQQGVVNSVAAAPADSRWAATSRAKNKPAAGRLGYGCEVASAPAPLFGTAGSWQLSWYSWYIYMQHYRYYFNLFSSYFGEFSLFCCLLNIFFGVM
jgi:hypothetical protein